MSTRKSPPVPAKKPTAPPRSPRLSQVAPPRQAKKQGRDLFGLYFIAGAAAFIFLFGAAVWTLRGAGRSSAAAVAPTATVETLQALPSQPVAGTPVPGLASLPTPALPAPDAVNSGAFAPASVLTSTYVADLKTMPVPPVLPRSIPQPRLDTSVLSFDLGAVTAQSYITRELVVGNTGTHDLLIQRLATDCRCVTAQAAARRLPSGTRTRIVLTYDGSTDDSPSGGVDHTLGIVSTDGQSPLTEVTLTVAKP